MRPSTLQHYARVCRLAHVLGLCCPNHGHVSIVPSGRERLQSSPSTWMSWTSFIWQMRVKWVVLIVVAVLDSPNIVWLTAPVTMRSICKATRRVTPNIWPGTNDNVGRITQHHRRRRKYRMIVFLCTEYIVRKGIPKRTRTTQSKAFSFMKNPKRALLLF
jgi:hypothetical protein